MGGLVWTLVDRFNKVWTESISPVLTPSENHASLTLPVTPSQILAFPELVVKSKRSSEKLFQILDLYDAVAELWPDIERIFAFESTAAVRSQAVASLLRLVEVARATLADFEVAIQRDALQDPGSRR
ncbi:hypothetical protein Cni_G07421 [Canna indica]|uniref:Exocyst subunit Exo70 family protein n=1 Tax=Canna indica TaxID=4628 RepID=A0AAQ3Q7I2_9LILI|nr:hypothetical protein Cni_G07421 [Canna indica]